MIDKLTTEVTEGLYHFYIVSSSQHHFKVQMFLVQMQIIYQTTKMNCLLIITSGYYYINHFYSPENAESGKQIIFYNWCWKKKMLDFWKQRDSLFTFSMTIVQNKIKRIWHKSFCCWIHWPFHFCVLNRKTTIKLDQ